MKYYHVICYRKPCCDDCSQQRVDTYIAAKDDDDYKNQLEDALWRAEDWNIKQLTCEQYDKLVYERKREKEHRKLMKYMDLHPIY